MEARRFWETNWRLGKSMPDAFKAICSNRATAAGVSRRSAGWKNPWRLKALYDPDTDIELNQTAKRVRRLFRSFAFSRIVSTVDRSRFGCVQFDSFAAHRSDFRRQVFRFFVGGEIGPKRAVEALADLEPDFLWIPEALELRAKSYAAVQHPMAFQAQQEWLKWMRQRSVGE